MPLGSPGGNGYLILGSQDQEYAGYAVAALGDLNGDGKDDLLVGAPDIGDLTYKGARPGWSGARRTAPT
ncbi:integrin alpha [Dankookia sp. P2]|uniref:integrin alpha n=1 Tax=Dankookia sp. P2 TaxID=3423955 RepID=UPI003D674277